MRNWLWRKWDAECFECLKQILIHLIPLSFLFLIEQIGHAKQEVLHGRSRVHAEGQHASDDLQELVDHSRVFIIVVLRVPPLDDL